jgi:hypothetical protein
MEEVYSHHAGTEVKLIGRFDGDKETTTSGEASDDAAFAFGYAIGKLGGLAVWCGFYIWALVICYKKGKPAMVAIGIGAQVLSFAQGFNGIPSSSPIGLIVIIMAWTPIFGAIRLAKPTSCWFKRYVKDGDKYKRALARYPLLATADTATATAK